MAILTKSYYGFSSGVDVGSLWIHERRYAMSLAVGVQSSRNYWWLLLVRSIVTVLFGIAALVWPGLTLAFFIYLFGVFAIVEGIIAIAASIQERQFYKNWWVLLPSG